MLAAPPLWIEQGAHRLSKGNRFNGLLAVVRVPCFEHLNNLTAMWIVRLSLINSVDGIATAKRQEWIAAPFGPLFEAAERPTVPKISSVLPTPASDGQGRGE